MTYCSLGCLYIFAQWWKTYVNLISDQMLDFFHSFWNFKNLLPLIVNLLFNHAFFLFFFLRQHLHMYVFSLQTYLYVFFFAKKKSSWKVTKISHYQAWLNVRYFLMSDSTLWIKRNSNNKSLNFNYKKKKQTKN